MSRMSSPGMYWRTSEKAMPRPLKTEWYCPAIRSRTRRSVTISILRIRLSSSRGSIDATVGAAGAYGTSTRSNSLRTTVSAVTSSASAS